MLAGPSFIPPKVSKAVILCHGYGASGEDLMGLVPYMKAKLPDTAFFAPNAPIDMGFGYEWFELRDYNNKQIDSRKYLEELTVRADVPAAELRAYIKEIQQKYRLQPADISLLGFSQGGLIVLLTALTNPDPVGHVSAMSCVPMIWTDSLVKFFKPTQIPMIITHGAKDPLIPIRALDITLEELRKTGQNPKHFISENLEHAIDQPCLDNVIESIKETHNG